MYFKNPQIMIINNKQSLAQSHFSKVIIYLQFKITNFNNIQMCETLELTSTASAVRFVFCFYFIVNLVFELNCIYLQ